MTVVRMPGPLRPYAGGLKEIEVTGGTVGMALSDLARRYPDLRTRPFDANGDLRPYVNLFRNEEDFRHRGGVWAPPAEGDRLMIVPSIAGGCTT
jgi:molybdopterin converting factor small subunit